MINRLLKYVFVTLLGVAASAVAMAQEGMNDFGSSDYERIDHERIMSSPGESDSRHILKSSPASKDSIVSTPATQKPVTPVVAPKQRTDRPASLQKDPANKQNTNKESDDSILSFNFLYYMIQKYKLQDIVD